MTIQIEAKIEGESTPPTLTSVGFFTHRLPPRKQPRMSRSFRATWAMLPVGRD